MSKVEVLCPNGHRVNVKTTPNTKLLQILEEVCTKQPFQPPTDYELRHGKKTLDLSLSMQYSGIPNLAKLELIKATKSRSEAPVTIALQLIDGERLMRDFPPSTSLFEILESFEQDDGRGGKAKLLHSKQLNIHPACLYLKDEIAGEYALRETSLRQLGLTSGRAIIRHIFKEISSADLDKINTQINAEKSRRERLATQSMSRPASAAPPVNNVVRADDMVQAPAAAASVSQDDLSLSRAGNAQDSAFQPMDFLPSDAFQSSSLTADWQYPPEPANVTALMPPPRSSYVPSAPAFASFKFPEETKGKDLYKNELSEYKDGREHEPCDRQTVIYHVKQKENENSMEVDEEIPDDFFDVTAADVRIMYRDLQKRASEAKESEEPLMTDEMKRNAHESRFSQYTQAIIRFHFPDGFIVQAVFRPRETVYALTKFVKDCLSDRQKTFELYTTPPRIPLKDVSKNLIEENLAPLAKVYISMAQSCDQCLSDSAICSLSDKETADNVVARIMTSQSDQSTSGQQSLSKADAVMKAMGLIGGAKKDKGRGGAEAVQGRVVEIEAPGRGGEGPCRGGGVVEI